MFSQKGQLYTKIEFIQHYKIPISVKDFSVLFEAFHLHLTYLFSVSAAPDKTQTVPKVFFSTSKNQNKGAPNWISSKVSSQTDMLGKSLAFAKTNFLWIIPLKRYHLKSYIAFIQQIISWKGWISIKTVFFVSNRMKQYILAL